MLSFTMFNVLEESVDVAGLDIFRIFNNAVQFAVLRLRPALHPGAPFKRRWAWKSEKDRLTEMRVSKHVFAGIRSCELFSNCLGINRVTRLCKLLHLNVPVG